VDGFTRDDTTYHAIKRAYHLARSATAQEIEVVTEAWHPFRMWVTVLLHVRMHELGDLPPRGRRRAGN
jgi:3-methyladenine DNA glycosylase/8-oxoguanine DNA glycosylase